VVLVVVLVVDTVHFGQHTQKDPKRLKKNQKSIKKYLTVTEKVYIFVLLITTHSLSEMKEYYKNYTVKVNAVEG
jgi:hypothetical protein